MLVSMAPPQTWENLTSSSCGNVWKKCDRQLGPRLRPALQVGRHLRTPVVDGVVAAPQDPVVGREPVVVELVGDVGQALAVGPADAGQLGRGERLGDQAVVVHGDHVLAQPLEQRPVGVRAEHDLGAADVAERGGDEHAGAVLVDRGRLGMLVDPHAELLRRPASVPMPAWPDRRSRHGSCGTGRRRTWGS